MYKVDKPYLFKFSISILIRLLEPGIVCMSFFLLLMNYWIWYVNDITCIYFPVSKKLKCYNISFLLLLQVSLSLLSKSKRWWVTLSSKLVYPSPSSFWWYLHVICMALRMSCCHNSFYLEVPKNTPTILITSLRQVFDILMVWCCLEPNTLLYCKYFVDWPFQCWGFFRPNRKNAKIFEYNLNHFMLVLIG